MKITKTQLRNLIKEELGSSMQAEAEDDSFEVRVKSLHSNILSAAEETYTGFDHADLKTFEELMAMAGIH